MTEPKGRSPYLVSPGFDWLFFLLPPAYALILGIAISGTAFTEQPIELAGSESTWAGVVIGVVIQSHLVAVLFRSHGNPAIFRLYRLRFLLVPALVWLAIVSSPWMAVTATVLATFWDVWHSGAQTFGFGRIYDRNARNPSDTGRKLDFWLSQLLYAGPILGGVTLVDHVEDLEHFQDLGATFFAAVPIYVESHQRYLTWAVLGGGSLFLVYYVGAYWRLYRRGYRPSFLKVYLFASTGACSIYSWGFNTWGEAFFIMNLFHAVQYLALVWTMEHERWRAWLARDGRRVSKAVVAVLFLGAVLGYGWGVQLVGPDMTTLWAITIVVSLMHFWYDGFVWSVRRGQV